MSPWSNAMHLAPFLLLSESKLQQQEQQEKAWRGKKDNIQMRPRSVNNRVAQDGCSSTLHVICLWWSSRAWAICHVPRPSGITQPCDLAFQHLSPSFVLYSFTLLAFISEFWFSSPFSLLYTWERAEHSEVMLNGSGCRGFPHRVSAMWPAIKLFSFLVEESGEDEDRLSVMFFSWKTHGKFLCGVC